MFHSKRNRVGANFVEYVIPVALVGIVVGMGAYMLTDGGKLANFMVSSTNSTLDNAKKLSINAGSNPLSSALAGSRKWLTQTNVFYTNDNNQTCIFFYCVGGGTNQAGTTASTSTTSSNDVYSVISAATTAITNIVSSSAGNLSPSVLETINSVIGSATQALTEITQPVGQVVDPLVSSIDPTTLMSQIIPQDVLQTIAESNTQLASGTQSSQSSDAGNLSALNEFLNNIPASTLSSASDTSTAAVETSGSAGDVNEIGTLINQVANQVNTEAASDPGDPKLQELSSLLKQIANKTVYNSGLAETQKTLENQVNSAAASGSYSAPSIDPYYYQYYYGSYQTTGMYQTGGLAATAIGNYMNTVQPYTQQMTAQLKEINDLHQQFKDLAGSDDKYKNLVNKIDSLVGNVNTINTSLASQATNIHVENNANSFYVNGIQYTNSQQTNNNGQNIGSST